MRVLTIKFGLALVGLGLMTACSDNGQPKLMNIRSDTPDEFSIMPNKPLEQPESYEELPQPTPGGRNRADVVPRRTRSRPSAATPMRCAATAPTRARARCWHRPAAMARTRTFAKSWPKRTSNTGARTTVASSSACST
jgi:hypothetical protein